MKNLTKKTLSEALKRQMEKKPISKITIADITEECGVSRMTFYYHFQDIYDLVQWTCEEEARHAVDQNKTYVTWEQGFADLLEAFLRNKHFVLNLYRSVEREQIERYMSRSVENVLRPVIEEAAKGIRISEDGKRKVTLFYTYAFLGVVLEWVRTGMKEDVASVVRTTAAILRGDFANSLANVSRMEHGIGQT